MRIKLCFIILGADLRYIFANPTSLQCYVRNLSGIYICKCNDEMCYFHYWCENCKYDFPSYTVTAGKKYIQFSNTFLGYLDNKKLK